LIIILDHHNDESKYFMSKFFLLKLAFQILGNCAPIKR